MDADAHWKSVGGAAVVDKMLLWLLHKQCVAGLCFASAASVTKELLEERHGAAGRLGSTSRLGALRRRETGKVRVVQLLADLAEDADEKLVNMLIQRRRRFRIATVILRGQGRGFWQRKTKTRNQLSSRCQTTVFWSKRSRLHHKTKLPYLFLSCWVNTHSLTYFSMFEIRYFICYYTSYLAEVIYHFVLAINGARFH